MDHILAFLIGLVFFLIIFAFFLLYRFHKSFDKIIGKEVGEKMKKEAFKIGDVVMVYGKLKDGVFSDGKPCTVVICGPTPEDKITVEDDTLMDYIVDPTQCKIIKSAASPA